jgi:hypothetical protein
MQLVRIFVDATALAGFGSIKHESVQAGYFGSIGPLH